MGRFIKNAELTSRSYATRAPMGSTSLGPEAPVDGQFRFNKDIGQIEVFFNGQWWALAVTGKVNIVKDTFVGDGTAVQFTPLSVSYPPGREAEVLVFVGNIFQNPGVAYHFINEVPDAIEFTSPPDPGSPIVVLHNFNSTQVTIPV